MQYPSLVSERDPGPKFGCFLPGLEQYSSVVVISLTRQASADAPADAEGEGGEGRLQSEQVMCFTHHAKIQIFLKQKVHRSIYCNILTNDN